MATRAAGPEYRLVITPAFDERRRTTVTLLRLETTRVFASFAYELSVEFTRSETALRFRVLGLRTPNLSLPSSGAAHADWELNDLRGTREVTVEGLDGKSGSCTLRFSGTRISVLRPPPAAFLEIVTPHTTHAGHRP